MLIVVKTFMHEHPIDGGVMVLDVPDYDPSDLSKNIPTGVYGIDRALIDPRMGQVVLLAGSEGTGKSTLIGQFMLNAIAYGFKSMIFSGEMGAEMIKQWVYNQAAQNVAYMTKIDIKYDRVDYAPRPQLKKMIDKHVGNNLIIFDDNILLGENPPRILDVFEEHAKRKGVKVFVIDNMMTSDYERYGPRGNTNIQETNFMRAATSMAKRIGVLIYVIDHPRKVTAGGSRKIENDEISGSGGKKNLAQITIILDRNDEEPDVTYAHIKKNRFGSIKTDVPMLFDISKREYRCKEKGVTTAYPWVLEYEVWLQNEREQSKKNKRLEVK